VFKEERELVIAVFNCDYCCYYSVTTPLCHIKITKNVIKRESLIFEISIQCTFFYGKRCTKNFRVEIDDVTLHF